MSTTGFACENIINHEMKLLDPTWGTYSQPKVKISEEKKDSEKFSKKRESTLKKMHNESEKMKDAQSAFFSASFPNDFAMGMIAQGCHESAIEGIQWYSDLLKELEAKFGKDDVYEYLMSRGMHFKKISSMANADQTTELDIFSNKDKKNFALMSREEGENKRLILFNKECKIEKVVVFPEHSYQKPIELTKGSCTLPEICARYQDLF